MSPAFFGVFIFFKCRDYTIWRELGEVLKIFGDFVIIWSHGMEGKRGRKEPGLDCVQVRVLMGFGHSPLATYEFVDVHLAYWSELWDVPS